MTIDFFVHPEHGSPDYGGLGGNEFYNNLYQSYLDNLIEVVKSSSNPILITGIDEGDIFKEIIPLEKQIKSASYLKRLYQTNNGYRVLPIERGTVAPKDWNKFISLISNHEFSEMRIHGSFMGYCTDSFATQLYAYLFRNEHWFDWVVKDRKTEKQEIELIVKLIVEHALNGDFSKSNIKYGVVLASSKYPKSTIIIKPSNSLIIRKLYKIRRQGNITHQLIDSNSKIYSI